LSVVLIVAGGRPVWAQSGAAQEFSEYEVKAAFLFNFMQFVEWPAGSTTNAGAPFMIGVLGEDPFGSILEETIKGETINGRALVIKRGRQVADIKDCHLVFICRSEKAQIKDILYALRDCSALTVSDIEQFCGRGGMIGLTKDVRKIRIEINQDAAKKRGLIISSKLLRLGRLTVK